MQSLKNDQNTMKNIKKIYDRIRMNNPKGMLNAVLNNPEMQDFLIGYPDNTVHFKIFKNTVRRIRRNNFNKRQKQCRKQQHRILMRK